MGRQPYRGGPNWTRCPGFTMRSTLLSRVGAERTLTQVLAVANTQRPVSATATLDGGACPAAAGFGDTAFAASPGGAGRGGAGIPAGVAVGTEAAAVRADTDTARSDEANDASAMESLRAVTAAVTPVSVTLAAGICADLVCSVRREIR